MQKVISNEKDFIKDALLFLELKYNVYLVELISQGLFQEDDNIEDDFYKEIDKYALKKIYGMGQSDYNIKFSYQEFLLFLIKGRNHKFNFRHTKRHQRSKYRRKLSHHKKQKTLQDIDKENWRKNKNPQKAKTYNIKSCYWGYRYKVNEAYMKISTRKELIDFLDNSKIDSKSVKISL